MITSFRDRYLWGIKVWSEEICVEVMGAPKPERLHWIYRAKVKWIRYRVLGIHVWTTRVTHDKEHVIRMNDRYF